MCPICVALDVLNQMFIVLTDKCLSSPESFKQDVPSAHLGKRCVVDSVLFVLS